LRTLQLHGIQTATDLESAYEAAVERDKKAETESGEGEAAAFLALLDRGDDGTDARLPRLRVILDSIDDEEWMPNLRYWHDSCHRTRQTLTLVDGALVPTRDPAQPT
jgi:hypothetical protein